MKEIEVAAAIIENDRNEILICRRASGSSMGGFWEFPGGKREIGESFKQCVIRECSEELDINLRIIKEFARFGYQYPKIYISFVFFYSEIVSGVIHKNVHKEVKWVSKNEMNNYSFCPADEKIVKQLCGN